MLFVNWAILLKFSLIIYSKVKGQNITLLNTHEHTPVEYSVTVCYEKFRTIKVLFLLTSNRWSMVWFDPMDLSSFFYT